MQNRRVVVVLSAIVCWALVTTWPTVTGACTISVPLNLVSGCGLEPLVVIQIGTDFVVSADNCGREFAEPLYEVPLLFYTNAKEDRWYTVAMVNLDAPLGDSYEYLWLAVNIPGANLKRGYEERCGLTVIPFAEADVIDARHSFAIYVYEQRTWFRQTVLTHYAEPDWLANNICGPMAGTQYTTG